MKPVLLARFGHALKRRSRSVLTVTLLAVTLLATFLAFNTFSHASAANGYNDIYILRNVQTGRCFAVPRADPDKGTFLIEWECNSKDEQKWLVQSAPGQDSSVVMIQNVGDTRCVDLSGGATGWGERIPQYNCDPGNPTQEWKLDAANNSAIKGTMTIKNLVSQKCLAPGTNGQSPYIREYDCDSKDTYQQWLLQQP